MVQLQQFRMVTRTHLKHHTPAVLLLHTLVTLSSTCLVTAESPATTEDGMQLPHVEPEQVDMGYFFFDSKIKSKKNFVIVNLIKVMYNKNAF